MTKTTQTNDSETPRYSKEDLDLLSQTRQERNRGRQSVQKIRNDFIEEDRIFYKDINNIIKLINNGEILSVVENEIGLLD